MVKTNLFKGDIYDWESWGHVFQSKELFQDLVFYILEKEGIENTGVIGNCCPGTNAVFRVDLYIVKVFFPQEAGEGSEKDFNTELAGLKRAQELGIPVCNVCGYGQVQDKYLFRYLILEYIEGEVFENLRNTWSADEKRAVGARIRSYTDKLNVPWADMADTDIVQAGIVNERWHIFSEQFRRERIGWLQELSIENTVYVHGDINPDNVIAGMDGRFYLIDFADALMAPAEYEEAVVTAELFHFDPAFLAGYWEGYTREEVVERCLKGLLLHRFGDCIISDQIGAVEELNSIADLKDKIACRIV